MISSTVPYNTVLITRICSLSGNQSAIIQDIFEMPGDLTTQANTVSIYKKSKQAAHEARKVHIFVTESCSLDVLIFYGHDQLEHIHITFTINCTT